MKLSELITGPASAPPADDTNEPSLQGAMVAPRRVRLSDLQDDAAPVIARVTALPDPTEGMSTWEKFRAGIGKGLTDASLGAEQLVAHNPLAAAMIGIQSPALSDPQYVHNVDARIAEKNRLDAPLADTTPGKWGSVVGEAAPTLLMPEGKAAQGLGWLGKTLRAARIGAKQGAVQGALQTVDDPDNYGLDKLTQVMTGAGIGGAAGGVLNRAGAAVENLLPSNAVKTVLNTFGSRANQTPLAAEGERLAQATGVSLTPGQVSGSKAVNMVENAARQSLAGAEKAAEGDRMRIQQLADHFNGILDRVSKNATSPDLAGARIQEATRDTIGKMEQARASQAAADYGKLRELTQNSVKLQPDNLRAQLADLAIEHGNMGTSSSDAIASFAKRQMDAGAAGGDLDKLLMLRSHLGKVASGQAKISGDPLDRSIAAKMLGAIDDDLEQNAANMPQGVGDALRAANANYRAASQQIDSVRKSPLGKLLGEDVAGALDTGAFNTLAPETVMARINKLPPSQLGIVRGIMEKDQPEAWATLKRSMLEDAFEKAKAMPASAGANTPVLQPSQLVKALGDDRKLRAVFNPQEASEIRDALDVARRLSDKTGYNFSGTAAQADLLKLFHSLSVKGAASLGGSALGMRSIARVMADADGRRALLELKRLPPASDRARQLAAQITAIANNGGGNAPDEGANGGE